MIDRELNNQKPNHLKEIIHQTHSSISSPITENKDKKLGNNRIGIKMKFEKRD